MWRSFGASILITLLAVLLVGSKLGIAACLTIVILIAIEITFSFDNAIVNANVLDKMSRLWRQLFLTIGVVIAIIGMRILFPIIIVIVSSHLSLKTVIDEALHHPALYSRNLDMAHRGISAFGGSFLLTLALYFLFDDNRQELWLKKIESHLQKIGGKVWLPPLLVFLVILSLSLITRDYSHIFWPGIIGTVSYTLLNILIVLLSKLAPNDSKKLSGKAGLFAFIYLEILDAAFSFDSVLGAFAITTKIILIVIGLGVGAVWVRSLTVFMVRRGTLKIYKYLEHGAHYAILSLSIALLSSIFITIPDVITGFVGLAIIGSSLKTSIDVMKAGNSALN